MRHFLTTIILVICAQTIQAQAPAQVTLRDAINAFPEHQERCGRTALHAYQSQTDPGYAQRQQTLNDFTADWIAKYGNQKTAAVVTVPVVVHVVYKNTTENITDAQIMSQIAALNQDYRRQNSDTGNTPNDFASIVADTEIEFCLASIDPQGNATTGITRTMTSTAQIGNSGVHYTAQDGKDGWDPTSYLNFWVCEITSGGFILGYATPPGTAAPAEDGCVMDYRFFGTIGTVQAPFDLGRTTTHEVGHYFNLEHIWGLNGGCADDDLVADTPDQSQENYGCPNHPSTSCSSSDMFMNYMDYVDDNCMNSFSLGQKARMLAALNGPRAGLLSSNGCTGSVAVDHKLKNLFSIYPNPSAGLAKVSLDLGAQQDVDLKIFNLLGKQLFQKNFSNVHRTVLELDLNHFAEGIYLIEMSTSSSKQVRRLVIQ